jgi:hypothetical protein
LSLFFDFYMYMLYTHSMKEKLLRYIKRQVLVESPYSPKGLPEISQGNIKIAEICRGKKVIRSALATAGALLASIMSLIAMRQGENGVVVMCSAVNMVAGLALTMYLANLTYEMVIVADIENGHILPRYIMSGAGRLAIAERLALKKMLRQYPQYVAQLQMDEDPLVQKILIVNGCAEAKK